MVILFSPLPCVAHFCNTTDVISPLFLILLLILNLYAEIPTAVVHTKGVMLTTAQTLKKEQLLRERGLGLGVVFVHTLTNTDLKGNGLV
jgi:uncharacterized membrane protein YecN with MAPEG domain